MEKLLTTNIWPEIGNLSAEAQRVEAVIAYVTSDKYLKMGDGDTLIVNASIGAIKNGETSADTLARLFKKGVVIYSLESVHAKLLVMDEEVVVVGSANASVSSNSLDEAVVLTNSAIVASQARSYIYQLAQSATLLDEDKLKQLCLIKVIRRGGRITGIKKQPIQPPGESAWIMSTRHLSSTTATAEREAVNRAKKIVQKKNPQANLSSIRWVGRSRIRTAVQAGDRFVHIRRRKGNQRPYTVQPPNSILWRQDTPKWTRFYYDCAPSLTMKELKWSDFLKLCKQAGIKKKVTAGSARELSKSEADSLCRFWPRSRSQKR
jgi:phosphatidylserine/phosphatidylglycerophosphate/cardiolipin synthase-like enzyme